MDTSCVKSTCGNFLRIRSLILAVVLLATGCAGFDPFGPQPLAGAVQSALSGRGNINVQQKSDGSVILHGWVEDSLNERAVERVVRAYPGVTGVVSYIFVRDL